MVHYSFEARIAMFVKRLESAAPCASAQEAHDMLLQKWHEVYEECGANARFLEALKAQRLCEADGWHDVDQEVCYYDTDEQPRIRVYLHRDGGIVLQNMDPGQVQIVFNMPGKRRMTPAHKPVV